MSAPLRVRRCGPYLLGRRIGAGGMASVFAARQESLAHAARGPASAGPAAPLLSTGGVGRLVAVKVMSPALAEQPAFRELFLREVAIAARLEHPNIVRVYDVGEADGEMFLAMELIHGASLAALFEASRGPLPLGVALRIVADAARGLHAAHELCDLDGAPLGLVHQDVSPQNLMVGYDGVTRLLDFGVARLGALEASRTDSVRGKPSYLAPEQLYGGRMDRRTDVFALGVVLHELLTGERLFERATIAACHAAILGERIPDVREVRADVPAEAAGIAERALRRKPEDRFASADEVRRAAARALAALGLGGTEEGAVGAWALATSPPAFSPAELERAIVEGAAAPGRAEPGPAAEDVSELPTMPAMRGGAPELPKAAVKPARTALFIVVASVAVLFMVAGILVGVFGVAGSGSPSLNGREPEEGGIGARTAEVPAITAGLGGDASPARSGAHEAAAGASATAMQPSPERRASSELPSRPAVPAGGGGPGSVEPSGSPEKGAPEAPAAAPAYLSVRSTPWGRVRVDGADVGDSPVPRLQLKPGTHRVSVANALGEQTQVVTLGPGEEKRIQFTF